MTKVKPVLVTTALLGACLAAAAAEPAATAPAAGPGGWRATVRDFAAQHFRHPAWGFSHAQRDYDLARDMAASDHVRLDDDVIYAAAYLHDIAAFAPWANPKVDHADEAARIVDTVLKDTGFPASKLEAVRGAIRTHMYDRKPEGAEALYLHDADSLDWLGAVGVARLIAIVDPTGGQPDGPAAVKMLEDVLAKAPPGILSPAGRGLLDARKTELTRFLADLRSETSDLRTL